MDVTNEADGMRTSPGRGSGEAAGKTGEVRETGKAEEAREAGEAREAREAGEHPVRLPTAAELLAATSRNPRRGTGPASGPSLDPRDPRTSGDEPAGKARRTTGDGTGSTGSTRSTGPTGTPGSPGPGTPESAGSAATPGYFGNPAHPGGHGHLSGHGNSGGHGPFGSSGNAGTSGHTGDFGHAGDFGNTEDFGNDENTGFGNDEDTGERLECGRDFGSVLEHTAAGSLDAHERACPECQAAVRDLAVLAEVTRELAEQPVAAPADLGTRVMRLVRAELRTGRLLPIGEPGERLTLTETAAARRLRDAVDAEPGVRARSCRIAPREDRAGAAVPGPVTVRLSVGVPYGGPIHALAGRLRARVVEAARDGLGLEVARVDVDVVGLEPEDTSADGGEVRR